MTDNNRKGDEFVQALQRFHAGLPAEHQAMLERIIGAATQDETSGYGRHVRTEDAPSTTGTDSIDQWAKLAEWLNQADDDTSGYARGV